MAGRIEYKYLVSTAVLPRLRADILPYLSPDVYAGNGARAEYSVRSIYYDTPHLACYREKDAGVEIRSKFRIRGYDVASDDSVVFLEIKKRRDAEIAKHRAPLPLSKLRPFLQAPDIARDILASHGVSHAHDDARRFLYYYYRLNLRPAVLVVYDREAFFGRFDRSFRVTIDKRLRGCLAPELSDLHDEQCLSPVMTHHVIFELKFFHRALPQWASQVIQRYSLPRMALSKYVLCMDLKQASPRFAQSRRATPVTEDSLV